MNDCQQRGLPFAEAEGTHAERSNLLGLAMLKLGVDAAEARLLDWLFAVTDGGRGEPLKKTYSELAARPRGMCCSVGKARDVVRRLRETGVLHVDEHFYKMRGQAANSYSIHWPAVRELLGLPGVATQQPPVATQQPPVATQQPPVATQQPNKEHGLLVSSSCLFGRPAGQTRPAGESISTGEENEHAADRSAAASWTESERARVVDQLRGAGYDHATASRLARESETALGLASTAVCDVVAEFSLPANRQRFRKCGAIGYRLRNGSWPTDGVVPLEAARVADQRRRVAAMESAIDRAVREGRARGLTNEEIRAQLRGTLPAEVCAARGW